MASSYAVGPGGWVERRWQREIGTSTTRNEATRHATHWPNGSFDQRYSDVFRNSARKSHLKKNKSKSETENQPGLKSHFLRMFSSYATSTATKKIDLFFLIRNAEDNNERDNNEFATTSLPQVAASFQPPLVTMSSVNKASELPSRCTSKV